MSYWIGHNYGEVFHYVQDFQVENAKRKCGNTPDSDWKWRRSTQGLCGRGVVNATLAQKNPVRRRLCNNCKKVSA